MTVRPGKLRTRVQIQRVTEARDAVGDPIETWATIAEAWASIEPVGGREFFQSAQTIGETEARIRVRYLGGLTLKDRIREKHTGTVWGIERIADVGSRRRVYDIVAVRSG